MINLGRCITYLLGRHKKVSLKGIGTFHYLQGPVRRIEFKPDKEAVSAHIIEFIKAQKWISYDQASHLLQEALDVVKTELAEKGSSKLDGLGHLFFANDQLTFEPAHDQGDQPMLPPAVVAVEPEPLTPIQEVEPVQEVEPAKSGRGWMIVLLLIVILAVGGYATHVFRPDLTESAQASLTRLMGSSQQEPAAEEPVEPAMIVEDQIIEDSLAAEATVTMTDSVDDGNMIVKEELEPNTTRYGIVVGSFTTMELAHKYADEMQEKGINLDVLDSRMPGNRKKVIFQYFPTRAEAYQALGAVQRTVEAGAWVAEIKP